MSKSIHCVESLYNLSLNNLSNFMNGDTLEHLLKWYPTTICFEVIWKILQVNDEKLKFVYNRKLPDIELSSIYQGRKIVQISLENTDQPPIVSYREISNKALEAFAKTQQIKFVDNCNFSRHFTLDVFFKLVEVASNRCKLFTIFQICTQIEGFGFPKKMAEDWIKSKTQENNTDDTILHYINKSLILGIFLGDAGWYLESALVLSHTYTVITEEWKCLDQISKLTKIIQCLAKWLMAVSNYNNFEEAKVVLQYMLNTITILENIDGRKLCIANAYVALSQYYFVLMEYNEAWLWAVKAVNELDDHSSQIKKLLVLNHTIKICSVLNKLSTAKKLINQLHTYKKEIDQSIHVEILLNEACYSLKADLAKDTINSYYIALDSRRNLFGYYNLSTAIVFVDYAYARYVCDYSTVDYNEAMLSISQGIFIMKQIGLPDDNMLLVNAGRIKGLILEEKALDIIMDRGIDIHMFDSVQGLDINGRKQLLEKMKRNMLREAEVFHLKSLEVSLKAVGERALLTAKAYCNLGRLYQSQEKYTKSEEMHLKAIEIKKSILGEDSAEVALSLGHLASLYAYQLKKFHEAEKLYLKAIKIYESTYGCQYTGLLYVYKGLKKVYIELKNDEEYQKYLYEVLRFPEKRRVWLYNVHTAIDENCTKDDLSLEKFKCILSECVCEKMVNFNVTIT